MFTFGIIAVFIVIFMIHVVYFLSFDTSGIIISSEFSAVIEKVFTHTLLSAPSTRSARSRSFKKSLVDFYECGAPGGFVVCLMLNIALPSDKICAAHLFRHSNEYFAEDLLGFKDINDVRNGLLLYKPIQEAFDHGQLSFVYDKESDEYHCRLWDDAIKQMVVLRNISQRLQRKIAPNDLQLTFGDLEGEPLAFRNLNRPFRRCLTLQARIARKRAVEKSGKELPDFEDVWSDGCPDVMARFFRSLENHS